MHRVKYVPVGTGPGQMWVARCTCRWSSTQRLSQFDVEDEVLVHDANVQRARAGRVFGRMPSLGDQRDYYQTRADNTEETPENRVLWQQLADELTHRLGDHSPWAASEPLF